MNPTHDWHNADGMELIIRRDGADAVGVLLGHEDVDDVHSTLITTSRLLEMIDTVQPGAVRAYLEQQEPTDAECLAVLNVAIVPLGESPKRNGLADWNPAAVERVRAALSAARAARRDEEKV